MYTPKISPQLISRLYQLRENLKNTGRKESMVSLVESCLEESLPRMEKEATESKTLTYGQKSGQKQPL